MLDVFSRTETLEVKMIYQYDKKKLTIMQEKVLFYY